MNYDRKRKEDRPVLAICYDFDKTLSPDDMHAAHDLADRLVAAGVKGIWNFTNTEIDIQSQHVTVESIHFADSLLTLSYLISNPTLEK